MMGRERVRGREGGTEREREREKKRKRSERVGENERAFNYF